MVSRNFPSSLSLSVHSNPLSPPLPSPPSLPPTHYNVPQHDEQKSSLQSIIDTLKSRQIDVQVVTSGERFTSMVTTPIPSLLLLTLNQP